MLKSLDEDSLSTRDDFLRETSGCLISSDLVFVGKGFLNLCRAKVGKAQTKWCFSENCDVKTHSDAERFQLSSGVFVRAGKNSSLAYVDPFIPAAKLYGQAFIRGMLEVGTDTTPSVSLLRWSSWFSIVNSSDKELRDLEEIKSLEFDLKKQSDAFTTPLRKSSRLALTKEVDSDEEEDEDLSYDPEISLKSEPLLDLEELRDESRSILEKIDNHVKDESGEDLWRASIHEGLKLVYDRLFKLADKARDLNSSRINALMNKHVKELKLTGGINQSAMAKILQLSSLVGEPPKDTMHTTIVGGLAEVQDDFLKIVRRLERLEAFWKVLERENEKSVSIQDQEKFWLKQKKLLFGALKRIVDSQKDLYAKVTELQAQMQPSDSKGTSKDLSTTEEVGYDSLWKNKPMEKSVRLIYDARPKSKLSSIGDHDGACNGHNQRFEALENLATSTQSELAVLKGQMGGDKFSVSLGSIVISSYDHLEPWVTKNLPTTIPFGCYLDPVSFMDRTVEDSVKTELSILDRFKMSLGADDAINVDSFNRRCPKPLGKPDSVAGLKNAGNSFLPGLPSSKSWEDPKTGTGMKNRLKLMSSSVKQQVSRNIAHRLGAHPLAASVASYCLDASYSFVLALISWISDTHLELTTHGYDDALSWQLVTQVVYHIFSADMDKARNFVRESLDAQSPKEMALAVLWGTFRTLEVAQEYMKHGFADHPSISSQYVKFLLTSKGEETAKLEAKFALEIKALKELVAKATQAAKDAKAAAALASNGVDQLKKKSEKK